MPYRTWADGETLDAVDINVYLANQIVARFANATERAASIGDPDAGMLTWLASTGYEWFNGTTWAPLAGGAASGVASIVTERPDPATIPGLMIIDSTIGDNGQPLWSNGVDWIDATGEVVGGAPAEPIILAGSATPPSAAQTNWSADTPMLGRYTAVAGTASSVFVYFAAGSPYNGLARVVLYGTTGGTAPTALLGYSTSQTVATAGGQWKEIPLTAPATIPAGEIWIGIVGGSNIPLGETTVSTGADLARYYSQAVATTPPDPAPASSTYTTQLGAYVMGVPA